MTRSAAIAAAYMLAVSQGGAMLRDGKTYGPVVPDKVEVREDKEGEIFSRGSYNEGYDNGWNDCIDAMLTATQEAKS